MAKRSSAIEADLSGGPTLGEAADRPHSAQSPGDGVPGAVAAIIAKFPGVLQPPGWSEGAHHRARVVICGSDSLDTPSVGKAAGGGRAEEGAETGAGTGGGTVGGGGSRILHSLLYRARLVVRRVADLVQGFAFLKRESVRGGEWYRAVAAALGQRFPEMSSSGLVGYCETHFPEVSAPEPVAARVKACSLAFRNASSEIGCTDELQHLLVCCHRTLGRWMVSSVVGQEMLDSNPFDEVLASKRMLPWNIEGPWWQSRCTACSRG